MRLEEKLEMFDHTQVAMKKLSAQVVHIEKGKNLMREESKRSTLTRQVEDLKEQLGARADSEYALQEENRRLQVELSLFFKQRFLPKSPKIDVFASKI